LLGGLVSLLAWNAGAQETDSIVPGRAFATTKISNTAAVSTTNGVELDKTVSINLPNTFAGQFTGLSVRESNGLPENSASWLIRGMGSYGMARENIAKLYVDGFEVNADYLKYLSPLEIESVSILKDAASLATFGMKGANGVIWIETKRGKIGKPTITVQVRGSLQQPLNIDKALNSYDFASLYNQAVSNDNGRVWTPYYSEQDLANYKNGTSPDVDWQKEVLKNTGNYVDANVLLNGGNKNARYNIVLTYADQEGLLNVNTDEKDAVSNIKMNKFNLRSNFDLDMFDIFEAKVDLGGRIENNKNPNYDVNGLMNDAARYPSNIYWPFDDEEKTHYSGTTLYPNNPVGSMNGLGWQSSRLRILQGNFTLKEKLDFITPGLYLKEAISFYSRSISTYNKTRNYARYYDGATTTTDQTSSLVAGGYGSGGMENWKQYVISAGYDRQWGKHALSSAVGLHVSDYQGDGRFSYQYHYLNYNGRANYVYDNRYVAEAGFSYFGSDSYAPGNRFGFYPTLSAAWILSNEAFLKSNAVIDFLKLRASAGKIGGSDTDESLSNFGSNGRFLYQQYYYYTGGFNSGNTTPYQWNSGLAPMFIANEKAFAETSMKYNIGLDVNLFKKMDVTLDAFLDKRSHILTSDRMQMDYYGNNLYMSNIGKMTNKGFEVSATWKDRVGGFGYSLFGRASYAKNTIDFMGEVPTAYAYNAATGRSLGARIGLVADGFYQLEDFNADGSLQNGLSIPTFGTVQPGDIKYKDLDNSGYIDDTDVTEIGKPFYPEFYYSFGGKLDYKGLDLNVMFRGSAGSSINLLSYSNQFVAFMDNRNAYEIAKGAWAYYPEQGIDTRQTATYPRLTTVSNDNNYRTNSFWIKNNDFLRIQYIELGYNLKLKTEKISTIRFFLNATNPLTWSNLLKEYNMDPESYLGYPALKTYSLGVSVTL
jgi:TonB-linked SusC/RagA family outer membrane protein